MAAKLAWLHGVPAVVAIGVGAWLVVEGSRIAAQPASCAIPLRDLLLVNGGVAIAAGVLFSIVACLAASVAVAPQKDGLLGTLLIAACTTGAAATLWLAVQIWTSVMVFEGDIFVRMRAAMDLRRAVPTAAAPPCEAFGYFLVAGFNIAGWILGWLGFGSLCCTACCIACFNSDESGTTADWTARMERIALMLEAADSTRPSGTTGGGAAPSAAASGVAYPYSVTGGYTLGNSFTSRVVARAAAAGNGAGGAAAGGAAPASVASSLPPYTVAGGGDEAATPAEPLAFGDTERMGGVPGTGGGWRGVSVAVVVEGEHPKSR